MTNIDRLRLLLPPDDNSSDLRLAFILENAENTLLDLLGRDKLPQRLNDTVIQLAVRIYNRLGNEGQSKITENDISVSFSDLITDDIKQRIRNYPRKVGAVNAADSKQTQKN